MAYDATRFRRLPFAQTLLGVENEDFGAGDDDSPIQYWDYYTPDQAADVDTSGYFNAEAARLRVGDFIFAKTATGGATATGLFVVKSNDGTVVDVSNITSFGLANTD